MQYTSGCWVLLEGVPFQSEYIVASEEMELEKAGKAVKVEQFLRDELKTVRGRS